MGVGQGEHGAEHVHIQLQEGAHTDRFTGAARHRSSIWGRGG